MSKRKSFFGTKGHKRPPLRPSFKRAPVRSKLKTKKPVYTKRYIVDETTDTGRTRKIRTFNDPERAKTFVATRRYRFPNSEIKVRVEKHKKMW